MGEEVLDLVDAAQHRLASGEDLHRHDRVEALALEDPVGAREVDVGRFAGEDLAGGPRSADDHQPRHRGDGRTAGARTAAHRVRVSLRVRRIRAGGGEALVRIGGECTGGSGSRSIGAVGRRLAGSAAAARRRATGRGPSAAQAGRRGQDRRDCRVRRRRATGRDGSPAQHAERRSRSDHGHEDDQRPATSRSCPTAAGRAGARSRPPASVRERGGQLAGARTRRGPPRRRRSAWLAEQPQLGDEVRLGVRPSACASAIAASAASWSLADGRAPVEAVRRALVGRLERVVRRRARGRPRRASTSSRSASTAVASAIRGVGVAEQPLAHRLADVPRRQPASPAASSVRYALTGVVAVGEQVRARSSEHEVVDRLASIGRRVRLVDRLGQVEEAPPVVDLGGPSRAGPRPGTRCGSPRRSRMPRASASTPAASTIRWTSQNEAS